MPKNVKIVNISFNIGINHNVCFLGFKYWSWFLLEMPRLDSDLLHYKQHHWKRSHQSLLIQQLVSTRLEWNWNKQERQDLNIWTFVQKCIFMIIWFARPLWKVSQLWKDPPEYPISFIRRFVSCYSRPKTWAVVCPMLFFWKHLS